MMRSQTRGLRSVARASRNPRMKDVTSTSFGYVIAFLLPGLSALACLPFWSTDAKIEWAEFSKAQNNVGLFLLFLLAGLTCGLQVTVLRWVLFEKVFCRGRRLPDDQFQVLENEAKLAAFRAVAEEHYRYHQFWGGMAIVLPVFFVGLLRSQISTGSILSYLRSQNPSQPNLPLCQFVLECAMFAAIEGLTIWAAKAAFVNYVTRGTEILSEHKKGEIKNA